MATNPGALRMVHVDLSARRVTTDTASRDDVVRYLGGRGMGAVLLARTLAESRFAPLSPEAPLLFAMGTLSGTNAPMTGRSNITFVSPATGLYCKTNVGGHFGLYCRLNGADILDVRGASDRPVYLWIDGDTIEVRSADHLWGRTVRETTHALEAEHGSDISVACIGPAGENRVAFAAVMASIYNAAARGGGGAVMGSKGLKAIAVARPRAVSRPADPEAFAAVRREVRDALYQDSMADSYFTYGTAASVGLMNEIGTLPSYNFQRGSVENIEELTSQHWNKTGLLKGRIGCASCIYSCHRFIRIEDGPYEGAYSAGPEYETVSALGTGPAIASIGALQRANELCNNLGLDTISAGGVIQWAMETHERGAMPEEWCGDLDLSFGNERTVIELLPLIAYRQGLGDVLAGGVKEAAQRVGHDSWKWAIHTRGLEQSRVETRGAMGYALAFAMNPRGPDHLHTECLAEFGMTPEMKDLVKDITGDAAYARPDIADKRAEIVRWHEDIYAVTDALGLCAFVTTAAYGATPARCAALFEAVTGIPSNAEAILRAGRRIITLERLINLRLGWRNDPSEYAPWRLRNERQEGLGTDEPILDATRMARMVGEYHALHGWDGTTGRPTAHTLKELELEEFAAL